MNNNNTPSLTTEQAHAILDAIAFTYTEECREDALSTVQWIVNHEDSSEFLLKGYTIEDLKAVLEWSKDNFVGFEDDPEFEEVRRNPKALFTDAEAEDAIKAIQEAYDERDELEDVMSLVEHIATWADKDELMDFAIKTRLTYHDVCNLVAWSNGEKV